MRKFDYTKKPSELLTPKIVRLLSSIHESKGKQELFIEQSPEQLKALVDIAIIQSTESSNRIEGIKTSDSRLKEIIQEKSTPKNHSEEEISGYRDVLTTIHENYEYIPLNSNIILQLHRDLYSYSSKNIGGNYKNSDNLITEIDERGNEKIRFKPVSAFETKEGIENLCKNFNEAIEKNEYDALLLIPMFILDFLCIHPFNDGNGRMSRLLTLLLLYKQGYIVGKYLSIEMLIEKTKISYYDALQSSSEEWHEEENNYEIFVSYFLGIMKKAYTEFENRVEHLVKIKMSKKERVKKIIERTIGKFTKKEIMILAPDISETTIERTLSQLLKEKYIEKIGNGTGTSYVLKEK